VGEYVEHFGTPDIRGTLRDGLLEAKTRVLHWLMCPLCDPEEDCLTMLAVVGWTPAEFLGEVMGGEQINHP